MATYLNNLRLKEIATGDESGTWGVSTNTNLELVTDGFSYGTKAIAADADETFTMPDATADATRGFYLKFTSAVSLTATRTVTLGPNTVSKVWVIENATTGSQIITIKQGSGATVDIPSGSKLLVVTDGAGAGAAVLNANPTEIGGSVTSVAVTGTVNGITLTGGPVTSSGTFTLGGTLGSVDLTSQITGTLPVANGGTALTALGTANQVLAVNAGGTALEYQTTTTGSVTSVDVSGGTTGLTTSGGPITGSGTVTLAGTLAVANGGTGATTLTVNNVVLGNGTSAVQVVAPSTSGNVLTSDGTTWASTAPGGGGFSSMVAITSSDASYSIPAETIKIIVVGGGGGGGTAGIAGGAGGASSAASGTETISTITGNGGAGGGYGNAPSSSGGAGGTASGGTLNSKGGGGGAYSTKGASTKATGTGGDSRFGGGGQGATSSTFDYGNTGGSYGGGGGGVYSGSGAGGGGGGTAEKYLTGLTVGNTLNITIGAGGSGSAGAAGVVIIEY